MKTLLCIICSFIGVAQAQVQKFPFNQPITEQSYVCLEKKDAIEVLDAAVKGAQDFRTVATEKIKAGACDVITYTAVYREVVYEVESDNYYAVFRITVGNTSAFVPAVNWVGESGMI